MGLLTRAKSAWAALTSDEERSGSLENPDVPLSSATLADIGQGGSYESAGVQVNQRSALSYAPLFQAVSMISGDVAKLPAGVYQRTDRGRILQRNHPVHKRINLYGMANEEVLAYKMWRRLMASALLWNNGYLYIDHSISGQVLGLYNLLPDRTSPVRYKGKLYYLTEVGGKLEAFAPSSIYHIEGLSIDNMQGLEMFKLFREDIAIGLARRRFTSKFFSQGMTAGGILQAPPNAKPEAVRKVQQRIAEKFSGGDAAFKTIVLRDGFRWYATQVDPEKAQLTEMDEQQARTVARMFNMTPSRLGVKGSTSYNSEEMAKQDYHDGTLSHWLIQAKAESGAKLLTEAEREADLYVDYNINALLWADAKTRSEIANVGIINGRFSPNETRAWENLDAYEGGDTYYQPLNVQPVGTQAARSEALQHLLQTTFTRAHNRLLIKAERADAVTPELIERERDAISEILTPAVAVALEARGLSAASATAFAARHIKHLRQSCPRDVGALRVAAETTAAQSIRQLVDPLEIGLEDERDDEN
jgi:HK97 family phage portal protein